MEDEYRMVRLKDQTALRLEQRKQGNDSFDSVVQRLLEETKVVKQFDDVARQIHREVPTTAAMTVHIESLVHGTARLTVHAPETASEELEDLDNRVHAVTIGNATDEFTLDIIRDPYGPSQLGGIELFHQGERELDTGLDVLTRFVTDELEAAQAYYTDEDQQLDHDYPRAPDVCHYCGQFVTRGHFEDKQLRPICMRCLVDEKDLEDLPEWYREAVTDHVPVDERPDALTEVLDS